MQSVWIPVGERIAVEAGDVIGIHYDPSAGPDGVVPYEDNSLPLSEGLTESMLSRIYSYGRQVLVPGVTVISGIRRPRRLPAIRAVVEYAV